MRGLFAKHWMDSAARRARDVYRWSGPVFVLSWALPAFFGWHDAAWTVAAVVLGSVTLLSVIVRVAVYTVGAVRQWLSDRRAMS